MKVLHYEHMGVGVILSQALRKLGQDSHVLSSAPHPFGFKEDFLFSRNRYVRKFLKRLVWRKYYDFDILHSHDNKPLPPYVLRHWRGALVQHYHDPNTQARLYTDIPSFISLPNKIKSIPEATWVPIPVDTTIFKPIEAEVHDKVCIGYCDQMVDSWKARFIPKHEVEAAAKRLGNKAYTLPLTGIIPHDSMPDFYRKIDVWVDRIGLDFYGFSAVEVASMGIPVVTQIGQEERNWVPECPFITTDLKGATGEIISLAEDEHLRISLGRKAREYALKVHDSTRVAQICLEQYRKLKKWKD